MFLLKSFDLLETQQNIKMKVLIEIVADNLNTKKSKVCQYQKQIILQHILTQNFVQKIKQWLFEQIWINLVLFWFRNCKNCINSISLIQIIIETFRNTSDMIPLNNTARLKSYLTNGALGFSVAALLIYLVIIGGNQEAIPFMTFQDKGFNFHVYCPIDSPTASKDYQMYYGGSKYSSANSSNLYVVYAQARNVTTSNYDPITNTTTNKTELGLYYCGLAREWYGTCQNAKLICTSPAPMFYLPVDQEVTIVWVNNISSEGIPWTEDGCYSPDSMDMDCLTDAKIPDYYRPQTEGCTFNSPTNYSFPSRKVRVNKTQVPLSPHIHGLQTRPAFDGNPLSWFNNVGDRGVGYFSLNDSFYFSQFANPQIFSAFQTSNQKLSMKIIKAANKQPAGNLFYHDHAMKSTKFNVAHGLAGMYILYNKTAEQYLPKGTQQKYILFTHANDGDIRNKTSTVLPSSPHILNPVSSHQSQMNHKLHKDKIFTLKSANETFSRNMTYRFKILNAHYDNVYYNVSFATYYNTIQLPNGTKVIQQVNPYTSSFPLTNFLTKVNFTIIGTDSTLFNEPVYNIDSFDAGSAQRIDILIKFGPQNGIPINVKNFYLICYDNNANDYVIKNQFTLNQVKTQNKYSDPALTRPFNVPFYNLSTIPKSKIAVNRMRPLLSRPSDERFVINGHYMYNMGQTENPKIGTVQDWYIINNLFEPHPIHFHLVNFQVMQTFDLKLTPEGCTLYQLDYFRFSNYSKFKGLNNADLCYCLGNLTLDETTQMYHFLGNYSLETDIKPSANLGQVSGLNVLQTIATANDRATYAQFADCPLNTIYKYVCVESTSDIKGWYKKWKQTALVKQYSVMVLRVRWASTNYDEKVKPYPYFAVSEDEMIEFPGFVYHCHILQHEDNEMMRPIMLTPSDKYIQSITNSSKTSTMNNYITAQAQNLNLNSIYLSPITTYTPTQPTNWYQKAKQINALLNCPA